MGEDYRNELQTDADKKDKNFYTYNAGSNSITLNETISDEEFNEISDEVDNLIGTFAC